MNTVIINPGTGPVTGSLEQAEANIKAFIEDLGIEALYRYKGEGYKGRHIFEVQSAKACHEIEMPPLPLEQVRYMGFADQSILDFPRLYVDGSSWIWVYALGVCFNSEEA